MVGMHHNKSSPDCTPQWQLDNGYFHEFEDSQAISIFRYPLVGHMESVTGIEDGGLRLYGCGRDVHLQKKESQKVKPKVCWYLNYDLVFNTCCGELKGYLGTLSFVFEFSNRKSPMLKGICACNCMTLKRRACVLSHQWDTSPSIRDTWKGGDCTKSVLAKKWK